jgi:hypothetical protein
MGGGRSAVVKLAVLFNAVSMKHDERTDACRRRVGTCVPENDRDNAAPRTDAGQRDEAAVIVECAPELARPRPIATDRGQKVRDLPKAFSDNATPRTDAGQRDGTAVPCSLRLPSA